MYRPPAGVDWLAVDGYTRAMPHDGLMSLDNTSIEACFAWQSRDRELKLAYGSVTEVAKDPEIRIMQRPTEAFARSLMDENNRGPWVINESRPAFNMGDFMHLDEVIPGQCSHVTNIICSMAPFPSHC